MKDNTVELTDTRRVSGEFIGDCLPLPSEFRELAVAISEYPFDLNRRVDFAKESLRYIQECMLTRMVTVGLRLEQYHFLVGKIRQRCRDLGVSRIILRLNPRNQELGSFLRTALQHDVDDVLIRYHDYAEILELSVTESQRGLRRLVFSGYSYGLLLGATLVITTLILIGRCVDWLFGSRGVDREHYWMGFANNRERVDYPLLADYRGRGLVFRHPDVDPRLIFRGIRGHRRSIFRMGPYNIDPVAFLRGALVLTFRYRTSLGKLLRDLEAEFGLVAPIRFARQLALTLRFHHLHYLMFSLFLTKVFQRKPGPTRIVFRGGNASGMYFAGLNHTSKEEIVHICHGTEFRPSNHSVHKIVDTVILASDALCDIWARESGSPRNKLLGLGRPYYEMLYNDVVPARRQRLACTHLSVLIVLTYGFSETVTRFVEDVIACFDQCPGFRPRYLLKQRPNVRYHFPELLERREVAEAPRSIFESLVAADVVVVGISDRGIIGMVGLDAIYCAIPTVYYLPGLNPESAGYSWNDTLGRVTFFSRDDLASFLRGYNLSSELMSDLVRRAQLARDLLGDSSAARERIFRYLARHWHKDRATPPQRQSIGTG